MTAQTISTRRRRSRRKATRQRLPLDLVLLALALAGLYLAARHMLPERQATPAPEVIERSAPIQAAPAPPALEPAAEPARRLARRAPAYAPAPQTEATEHDPFSGLQPLSAAELDAISQAR